MHHLFQKLLQVKEDIYPRFLILSQNPSLSTKPMHSLRRQNYWQKKLQHKILVKYFMGVSKINGGKILMGKYYFDVSLIPSTDRKINLEIFI